MNRNWDGVYSQLTIVFLTWIIVIAGIGIDLYFGIKKSRKEGVYIHSYGLRQTTEKTVTYLALMLLLLFVDILNPFFVYFDYVPLPLFSIFGAIVLTYTEYKSIREKTNEKFRNDFEGSARELMKLLKENKDYLNNLKNKE